MAQLASKFSALKKSLVDTQTRIQQLRNEESKWRSKGDAGIGRPAKIFYDRMKACAEEAQELERLEASLLAQLREKGYIPTV